VILCVSVVNIICGELTTEAQRTTEAHREI
jgi:hypothetical protein